jgi:hypothetical protein
MRRSSGAAFSNSRRNGRNGSSSRSTLVTTGGGTRTDQYDEGSAIDDLVIQLRQVGTDRVLVIPPLRSRPPQQIAQVIQEYFSEALAAFDVEKPPTAADRAWIAQHSAQSLSEVAKGTRRLVALRREDGLADAANLLDMAPPSLQRWLKHRGNPPGLRTARPPYRPGKGY